MAGSALEVWEAFNFHSTVVKPTVARITGTNVPRLCRAKRTGDLGGETHLSDHKSADFPLLQGAELAAGFHLLAGSWHASRRRSPMPQPQLTLAIPELGLSDEAALPFVICASLIGALDKNLLCCWTLTRVHLGDKVLRRSKFCHK